MCELRQQGNLFNSWGLPQPPTRFQGCTSNMEYPSQGGNSNPYENCFRLLFYSLRSSLSNPMTVPASPKLHSCAQSWRLQQDLTGSNHNRLRHAL